jgi:helix-turn-helix protein
MQANLEKLAALASDLPCEDLPRFLGELRTVELKALTRLWASEPAAPSGDTLVDVAEAARRLGQSEEWIYRNQKHLGFVRRNGRSLRCSSHGLDAYIRKAGR